MSTFISILSVGLLLLLVACIIIGTWGTISGLKNKRIGLSLLSIIVFFIGVIPSVYFGYCEYVDRNTIITKQTVIAEVIKKEYDEEIGRCNITLKYEDIECISNNSVIFDKINEGDKVNVQLVERRFKNNILNQILILN